MFVVKLYGFCLSIAYIARWRHPYIESLQRESKFQLIRESTDSLMSWNLSIWRYCMHNYILPFIIPSRGLSIMVLQHYEWIFLFFFILTSCARGLFSAIYTCIVIGASKFTNNPAACDKKCRSKHQVLFARAGMSGTRLTQNSNNNIHDSGQYIHSGRSHH